MPGARKWVACRHPEQQRAVAHGPPQANEVVHYSDRQRRLTTSLCVIKGIKADAQLSQMVVKWATAAAIYYD